MEGNVAAHIPNGSIEAAVRCYDRRDDEFKTLVVIDLFVFLPIRYNPEDFDEDDSRLPSWQFVVEAIQVCARHEKELWKAWDNLKDDTVF